MNKYHKIQTVFDRDPDTNFKTLLLGQYSRPEFEYLADLEWVFTEKVDGTNIRIMFDGETVKIGGRTDNSQIPLALHSLLDLEVRRMDDKKLKCIFDSPVCFYGEGYGANIQKGGGNYRSDQSFVLFDIKIGDMWLQRFDIEHIAYKLGLDIVPIIGQGSLENMVDMTRGGFYSKWGDFIAEGIVARPKTELMSRTGHRIITKIKYTDFTSS